jgi:hypothetical protein
MRKFLFPLALVIVAAVLLLLVDQVQQRPGVAAGAVAPPRLAPGSGVYAGDVAVTLRANDPLAQVVFATDGTRPSATVGTLYERPLRLAAAHPGLTVVRAVEVSDAGGTVVTGPVRTAAYLVGVDPALPVISLALEPRDLWGAEGGLLTHPSWRGAAWEREAYLTALIDGAAAFELPVGVRIHGTEPYDAPKQSLRLYVRGEYGRARLETPLFPGHPYQPEGDQRYERLQLQAGEHRLVWTLLRDHLAAEAAARLGVPAAQGRFVWLFLNGTSWGLYRLTERVDRFFLEDNLDITSADVVREGDARDGSDEAWDALIDWVGTHDLRDPAHYARLEEQVNLDAFTDVAVLYRLFDLPAESLIAVRARGGRWFWVFEGGGQGYGDGTDFAALLEALLRHPGYRRRFDHRAAHVLNTVMAPEALARRMAALTTSLDGAYAYERGRWAGVPAWDDERLAMTRYLAQRAGELRAAWGPARSLHLAVEEGRGGQLYVDGYPLPAGGGDWTGRYGDGAAVRLVAVPDPGYTFAGWRRAPSGAVVETGTALTVTLTETATLRARFLPAASRRAGGDPRPDDVVINEIWINDNGTRYAGLNYRPLEGDWVELLVRAPSVDLRGWRLTDNRSKRADTEGSIRFPDVEAFADVPCGTVILIVATPSAANAAAFPRDDLDVGALSGGRRMVLYVGNGLLDVTTDPGFSIGTGDEAVALLAPGPTPALHDDVGVDFVAEGRGVTPDTFGVLADGVTFATPFQYLGRDDGALFTGRGGNDALEAWVVDPPACRSQDARCLGEPTLVSPGALNPGQGRLRLTCLAARIGWGAAPGR